MTTIMESIHSVFKKNMSYYCFLIGFETRNTASELRYIFRILWSVALCVFGYAAYLLLPKRLMKAGVSGILAKILNNRMWPYFPDEKALQKLKNIGACPQSEELSSKGGDFQQTKGIASPQLYCTNPGDRPAVSAEPPKAVTGTTTDKECSFHYAAGHPDNPGKRGPNASFLLSRFSSSRRPSDVNGT